MKSLLIASSLFLLFNSTASDISDLPINKIQVIGSHNSYKQAIDPALFWLIKSRDSVAAKGIEYSHISLSEQLSLGLQNLEIDVYADVKGGKYAFPKGLEWTGESDEKKSYDPAGLMKEPGFKVLHIQDIDFRSSCLTLKNCLLELKNWSDSHAGHLPIFVTMNAKDEAINHAAFTVPEKFTPEILDQLDNVILENLGRNKILIPDDIRGNAKTLEAVVRSNHWPTVSKTRGKFIFILDETGEKMTSYIQGHPALKNRVLFVNAEPGNPEAAFLIINDPLKDSLKIKEMVEKGYMVRTRADADTQEARDNDKRRFEAACKSGAQIITTDYYKRSVHFKSDYSISFENGEYARRNPILH